MSDSLSPVSRFFFSQRLRLHYVDWGNADAPPLVLVHGSRDHCRSWDWVARRLARDWHVIAPDLRGHGDSQWCRGGGYMMAGFIADLAQLVGQQRLAPVAIVAHSLGANIALRYSGVYPETVAKLVAIEGLGPTWAVARAARPIAELIRTWVDENRKRAGKTMRRFATIDEAAARMHEANPRLTSEQARHLAMHGANQNEDGTFSWKFDPCRVFSPRELTGQDVHSLWQQITCPTLLVGGSLSHHVNPATDGSLEHFKDARVAMIEGADHWVHHDQPEAFLETVQEFLR